MAGWADLATEAETAAAHQSPYATASYHSSQLLSKSYEFEVYKNMMIYSKYFFFPINLFIKFNVAYQWEEKNKLKQILLIFRPVRDYFQSENNILAQHDRIKDIKVKLKFEFSSLIM